MNETEVLVDVAVLGKQIDNFLKSDIGAYLLDHANYEVEQGVEALKRVTPTAFQTITELQNKIWRAESIKDWLTEAITAGLRATEVLESREDD